jgi:hypothetical protein
MRRLTILMLVVVFCAAPVVAFAQTTGYPPDTGIEGPCMPAIVVAAEGLAVDFSTTCGTADCTWDFGDGATGSGNPASHVFAADGDYTVTATCGDTVITRTLTLAADLSFTGFGLMPFGVGILALVVLGTGALWASRRARSRG